MLHLNQFPTQQEIAAKEILEFLGENDSVLEKIFSESTLLEYKEYLSIQTQIE